MVVLPNVAPLEAMEACPFFPNKHVCRGPGDLISQQAIRGDVGFYGGRVFYRRRGYRGVSWDSRSRNYTARISVNGDMRHLGCYHTTEEAAHAFARAYLRQGIATAWEP